MSFGLHTLCASQVVFAGNDTGNGGSPALLRKKVITDYIQSMDLKGDVLDYAKNFIPEQIADPVAREALKKMKIQWALDSDISRSKYVISNSCSHIGGKDEAGAIDGQLGGDICLSPAHLAALNPSKAELIGLLIHEHAHHFGYDDQDYLIYNAVYQTARPSKPDWVAKIPHTAPAPAPVPGPLKVWARIDVVPSMPECFPKTEWFMDNGITKLDVKPKSKSVPGARIMYSYVAQVENTGGHYLEFPNWNVRGSDRPLQHCAKVYGRIENSLGQASDFVEMIPRAGDQAVFEGESTL
jgi:hypothetical protein